MSNKFNRVAGKHPYFDAERACGFLPVVHQLLRLQPGTPFQVHCRTRARNTILQRFSFGRQFITDSATHAEGTPEAVFHPFVNLVKPIRIGSVSDQFNMLSITAPPEVYVIFTAEPLHPLMSTFTLIDEWIRADSAEQYAINLSTIAPALRPAVKALAAFRPGLESIELEGDRAVLVRRLRFFQSA